MLNNRLFRLAAFVTAVLAIVWVLTGGERHEAPMPLMRKGGDVAPSLAEDWPVDVVVLDTVSSADFKFLFVVPASDFLSNWPALIGKYVPPAQVMAGLAVVIVPLEFEVKPRDVIGFISNQAVQRIILVGNQYFFSYTLPEGVKCWWFVQNISAYQALVRQSPLYLSTLGYCDVNSSLGAGFY